MLRRSRSVALLILVTASVLAAAGCTLNKGTAFAEQFRPFLEDRERLAASEVIASNDLPGLASATVAVTLREGLDDDEIVEEVLAIAHHEVDDQIDYRLEAAFETVNGSGAPVVTSLVVRVHSPMPDTDRSRALIGERVERAHAIAAADPGLTTFDVDQVESELATTSDPLEVAQDLAPLLAGADELGRIVVSDSGTGAANAVELPQDADTATLDDLAAVLDLVRDTASVVRYEAVAASPQASASLRVDLAALPADPRPLVEAAADRDVALVLPTPAPVAPADPTS